MYKQFIISILVLISFLAKAQKYVNYDYIYQDNIRSVKCNPSLDPTRLALIPLSGGELRLSFDDLDGELSNYRYTIQYCNSDWSLYDGSELDYIEGFVDGLVTEYHFSVNTLTNYTHYDLELPNESTKWTRSGNYLLHIFNNTDKTAVLTRQFMVFDNLVSVIGHRMSSAKVDKRDSHQEIDFDVQTKNLSIRNPKLEVKATILQNGRWDKSLSGIRPTFERAQMLIFDEQDVITFPAEREFHYLFLTSLRAKNDRIDKISRFDDGYDVTLKPEIPLLDKGYIFNKDANGQYIIDNRDQLSSLGQSDWTGDYANTLFTLAKPSPYEEGDVYVCGRFSDYLPYSECKMEYDDNKHAYFALMPLKQGYYNYKYAILGKDKKKLLTSSIDGDWYETENDYTILIYYHPIGTRYDQLIGVGNMNTLTF